MARKEITIAHDRLRDPQTITKVVSDEFAQRGLDIHRHEASHEDDHRAGTRVYKIKSVKFYGPWSHRG